MAAQVGVVAAFQSSDQLFAVEILAGALQAFDQPASADGGRGQFVFLEHRRDAVLGPAKRSEGNSANGSLLRSTGKTTKK